MVDGVFDLLTCRPKLTIKHTNNTDYITLETKNDSSTSANHLTLEISKSLRLYSDTTAMSNSDIVYYLWGFENGVWVAVDRRMPHGNSYIRFADTGTGMFGDLALVRSSGNYDAPLLTWSDGLIVKKDITAGGYVASNQGLIAVGSGMQNQFDPPGAWLIHSGIAALHDIQTSASPPSIPPNKYPYYIKSTDNHLYFWNGSAWVDKGHKNQYNFMFDTFYIRKAGYQIQLPPNPHPIASQDLGNLVCYNIDAEGKVHGGGDSGDAFQVGNDILLVDINAANRLSLQGMQNRAEGGIQFGSGGPYIYRDSAYMRVSSGLIVEGYIVATSWANTTQYGPLYRNGSGQIGYNTSSERYKDNIKTVEDCSWIYNLRPVNFDWKDGERAKAEGNQLGLIAEEVHKQYPQLTWLDSEGKPEGVHYEWLGIPLLVELKKLRKEVEELKAKLVA